MPALGDYMIMGELGLDGTVRDVPGALPIAELAVDMGLKGCILPLKSAAEAIEYTGIQIYGIDTLDDAIRIVEGSPCDDLLAANRFQPLVADSDMDHSAAPDSGRSVYSDKLPAGGASSDAMDFSEIVGQEGAKRGLEIAAAGGHNAILIGSQGCGKSSLAKAMAGILPELSFRESIQTSKIYSVAGKGNPAGGLIRQRPFRAPHYSISIAALLGGGSDTIIPGEISLAHNGILFINKQSIV
jgi:magnesium chelatase family protein